MKIRIKDLCRLEKDILKSSSGKCAVVVLDTGGLIDIANSAREYNLTYKKDSKKNPVYERATAFLTYLSGRVQFVITPKTYQEIQDHGRMRLNSHVLELTPRIVDHSLKIMLDSVRFLEAFNRDAESEQARYDAYWASKEGCNGNHKKSIEGCTDVDKEILSVAAYLSRSKAVKNFQRIDRVLVISPDAHIIQGAEFLKRGFDGTYPNIVPISTRY